MKRGGLEFENRERKDEHHTHIPALLDYLFDYRCKISCLFSTTQLFGYSKVRALFHSVVQ